MQRAVWTGLVILAMVPVVLAAMSPFLAWRSPIYIVAGFAGILALPVLLLQPILAARLLPIRPATARRWHRRLGLVLTGLVVVHIAGLYVTSPPDTIDALTFAAPTAFSIYGVLAMWGVVAIVVWLGLRGRLKPRSWKAVHNVLAAVVVVGTIVHALQIQGAMEVISKTALACAVGLAAAAALWKIWLRPPARRRM
ncbi:MAG: ferric reductase-like transmembrane domain-containing protein [Pseudomonadota bacterium]